MKIKHLPPGFEKDEMNIGIDFDGVIHNMYKGYHDGTIYGEPIQDALDSLKKISKKYNIIVFTAKAKPDRPLVNGKTGVELVWDWLRKHNVDKYVKDVTAEKPRAVLYIDDNGFRFKDWKSTINFIETSFNT
jgi:hypothetical protein